MASYKQFRNPFCHDPQTAMSTLAQLAHVEAKADLWDLMEYMKRIKKLNYCLNGVHQPFWQDWPLSDPSQFLTPEPLHHWHEFFPDHNIRWCIQVAGAAKFDFHFAILQPHTGF